MTTNTELILSNIVLLGEFEPAKFDKLFFIKNKIFLEDEFEEDSLFSQNISRIVTEDYKITISKKQILISCSDLVIIKSSAINFINIIISNNPKNISLGFNKKWLLFTPDISKYTTSFFYPVKAKVINEFFNTEDSAFGYYASKSIGAGRFKVDIKPTTVVSILEENEFKVLSFSFNFHFENLTNIDVNKEFNILDNEAKNILNGF